MGANDMPVQGTTTYPMYPFGNGWTCASCGTWVAYGASHQCGWHYPYVTPNVSVSRSCRECGCYVGDAQMHRVTHEHAGHTVTASVYCEHHCPECNEGR